MKWLALIYALSLAWLAWEVRHAPLEPTVTSYRSHSWTLA